ncbi:MAG: Holliday junction resolvase RuvX [Firmicutes bacterium]|nr:Holliday junction resolvase RuvX [Bacillota bacterium]
MILAIDYGKVRLGLATSNGELPTPISVIKNQTWSKLVPQIVKVCFEKKVNIVVFGLPLFKDGTESPMCKEIYQFANRLKNEFVKDAKTIKIFFINENCSSKEAGGIMANNGKRLNKVDQTAACVILQRYIDAHKSGAYIKEL